MRLDSVEIKVTLTGADAVTAVRAGRAAVSRLFRGEQRRFLADGGPIRINLDALTLLPPVTAVRWPVAEGVRAERWTFLELSVVARPAEAQARQDALHGYVAAHGGKPDPAAETKTRRVVRHLVDTLH